MALHPVIWLRQTRPGLMVWVHYGSGASAGLTRVVGRLSFATARFSSYPTIWTRSTTDGWATGRTETCSTELISRPIESRCLALPRGQSGHFLAVFARYS